MPKETFCKADADAEAAAESAVLKLKHTCPAFKFSAQMQLLANTSLNWDTNASDSRDSNKSMQIGRIACYYFVMLASRLASRLSIVKVLRGGPALRGGPQVLDIHEPP